MAPIINLIIFLVLFPLFAIVQASSLSSSSWAQTSLQTQNENPKSQNLTKLHFYFHDVTSGHDKSVALIAKPENSTSYGFGSLVMIDDPLTVGPNRTSELVGRAQGMYGLASQNDPILLMTMTFSFTQGSYNGSSISILGKYNVADEEREMPVIGGSGVFKLASGYAVAKPYRSGVRKDEDTAEYSVFVLHSNAKYSLN
ncbi:hypothetical protein V2J09_012079 [Rumex salicifolius]